MRAVVLVAPERPGHDGQVDLVLLQPFVQRDAAIDLGHQLHAGVALADLIEQPRQPGHAHQFGHAQPQHAFETGRIGHVLHDAAVQIQHFARQGDPANASSSPTRWATADCVVCSLRDDALKLPNSELQ
ncbi:hypothetical protein G6F59_017100 [Rhizopus arrhizus]|nr:hypothetical protein G6F59_017100 [Rhizopus arrhizus]